MLLLSHYCIFRLICANIFLLNALIPFWCVCFLGVITDWSNTCNIRSPNFFIAVEYRIDISLFLFNSLSFRKKIFKCFWYIRDLCFVSPNAHKKRFIDCSTCNDIKLFKFPLETCGLESGLACIRWTFFWPFVFFWLNWLKFYEGLIVGSNCVFNCSGHVLSRIHLFTNQPTSKLTISIF